MVGPVAEELVAAVATQVVGELGGEVVHELVGAAAAAAAGVAGAAGEADAADVAGVAVEAAHVIGDETDFEVSSCSHLVELGPAEFVGPAEQAVVGLTEPVEPAAA